MFCIDSVFDIFLVAIHTQNIYSWCPNNARRINLFDVKEIDKSKVVRKTMMNERTQKRAKDLLISVSDRLEKAWGTYSEKTVEKNNRGSK